MKFNSEKSKEIIVSFAQDGNFRNTIPNTKIVKKAGKRLYMLYQLKRAGISQADLVSVYVSVLRPVLEYACPVWHTNLPQNLCENIAVIQKGH